MNFPPYSPKESHADGEAGAVVLKPDDDLENGGQHGVEASDGQRSHVLGQELEGRGVSTVGRRTRNLQTHV